MTTPRTARSEAGVLATPPGGTAATVATVRARGRAAARAGTAATGGTGAAGTSNTRALPARARGRQEVGTIY